MMHPMKRLALASLLGCSGCGGRMADEQVLTKPTDVVVTTPGRETIEDYEEFTGHMDAIRSVQIRARVTGYLVKKDFSDGQDVKEGDVLYEIDDRPYKMAFDSAEAQVARGDAHRNRLKADFKRATNLFERGAIGKQEFDLISSDFAEAEADLGASKARLDTARLNLDFTKITAPMSGQLSRSLVDPGNLIRQDETVLNDIVAVDRLYAYFDVSEEALERISHLIEQGRVGGRDNKEVPVTVGTTLDSDRHDDAMKQLRDLKDKLRELEKTPREAEKKILAKTLMDEERRIPDEFPYHGEVNFAENKIDAATGTLRIRGVIDNSSSSDLVPGLFVKVRLPIGNRHVALLVPDDSIGSDQGRRYLYVVNPQDEVEYRPIEVGAVFSGPAGSKLRAIRSGVEADERFIKDSEALRRVRPGAKVSPKLVTSDLKVAESSGSPAAGPASPPGG